MAIESVQVLGTEIAYPFLSRALEASTEARAVYEELTRQGLEPQPERTRLFNTFSRDSFKSIAISVTPFTTRDQTREGGLSVSQGGHAQAVIVEISGRTEITGFTHIAVSGDEVVTSTHDVEELRGDQPALITDADVHIKAMAEQAGRISAAKPLVEIEARQVRSLASIAYNSMLGDDFSHSVHDEDEITALRASTNIVAQIGLFVLFRTSGSACCSCSCSCWGSSSCSCSYIG
jgi:hypothetical protein